VFGRVRKLSRDSQDRVADASAMAGEILNAMPTVQAFTHERSNRSASAPRSKARSDRHAPHPRPRLLTMLAIVLVFGAIVFVLWLGAHAVLEGR
jgi:ATP-binding cassette subfamily B protein